MKHYFELNKENDEKLYLQLYNIYKYEILNHNMKEGEKMPSIRQVSNKYCVNISTVLKAYDLLEAENFIVKTIGKGSFVSNKNTILINEEKKPILNNFYHSQFYKENFINFAKGTLLPSYFPVSLYENFSQRIFKEDSPRIFEYQDVQGLENLREVISDIVEEEDIFIKKEDIIVTNGTQQSLNVIVNFFKQKGKPNTVLGKTTYPNALNLFKNCCNTFAITQEHDGWDLVEFEMLLKTTYINFVYEVFNFQNPTGVTWSDEKKRQLVKLSQDYNFYIIEDNSFSDFYYSAEKPLPIKSFVSQGADDNIFYLKTFSKIIMPGIETAFVIPPQRHLKNLVLIKHSLGTTNTGFNQRILQHFLESSEFKIHFNLVKNHLKEKFLFLLKSLSNIEKLKILFKPAGGFFIWIELLPEIDIDKFYSLCAANNLNIISSSIFFTEEVNDRKFRLSISSLTLDEIMQGVSALEDLLHNILKK